MNKNLIANLHYIFDNMKEAVCITNKFSIVQYVVVK